MERVQESCQTDKESLNKSKKKIKEPDDQNNKSRKISDFFKTPEKTMNHKQKSLLHFFTKSPVTTKTDSATSKCVTEGECKIEQNGKDNKTSKEKPNDDGELVSTPNGSDKENQDSLILVDSVDAVEKTTSELGGGDDAFDLDSKKAKKKKKHKKHKKERAVEDNETVELLSESSNSLPEPPEGKDKIADSVDKEECREKLGDKISNKDSKNMDIQNDQAVDVERLDKELGDALDSGNTDIKKHKKKHHKKHKKDRKDEENESIVLLSESSTCNSLPETENGKKNIVNNAVENIADNIDPVLASKQENTTFRNKIKDIEGSVKNVDNSNSESVSKKSKKHKKSKTRKLEFENIAEDSAVLPIQRVVQLQEEKAAESSENEGSGDESVRSSKKSLKVKEMMNLLKEIQDSEKEDKTTKRKKKKHKHHKKARGEKETQEISCIDNLEKDQGDKEQSDQPVKVLDTEGNDCDADNGADVPDAKEMNKLKDYKGEIVDPLKKHGITKDIAMKCRKTKKDKDKISKKAKSELSNTDSNKAGAEVSYSEFKDDLETKEKVLDCKKEEDKVVMEMSYSEYLEKLDKNMTEEGDKAEAGEEDMEVDVEEIGENHDENVKEKPVPTKTPSKTLDKNGLKSFFTIMTSTPELPKSKTKSIKNITAQKATCKKELDQEKLENSESNNEISKDMSCRVNSADKPKVPAGKKCSAQATLSFGKSGLGVAKPIVMQEENVSAKDKETEIQEKDSGLEEPVKKKRGRPKTLKREYELKETSKKLVKKHSDVKTNRNFTKETNGDGEVYNIADGLNITDSDVFVTPAKVDRDSKRKVASEEVSGSLDESTDNSERRRSLRKRYKVQAFQMDAERRTPIKIKLKRCPKSSSSGADDADQGKLLVKKSKNLAAHTLLMKAKRGKPKKYNEVIKTRDKIVYSKKPKVLTKKRNKSKKSRSDSNSSEDSCRRSSRLEGRVRPSMEEVSLENIVISSDADDDEDSVMDVASLKRKHKKKKKKKIVAEPVEEAVTKKEKPKKRVSTPVKQRSPTKKAGGKLAPMFLMGKSKASAQTASPKKPPIDPELARQRQAFLMSGVPDALKKQTATRMASTLAADYPPLPEISHVQQIPQGSDGMSDIWKLEHRELKLSRLETSPSSVVQQSSFNGGLITPSLEDRRTDRPLFTGHAVLSEAIVAACLAEIKQLNPSFPVHAMYRAMKNMKTETEKPPAPSESMMNTDMTGILAGYTDMVVIDDDDDENDKSTNSKKSKKKKLKLSKKEEPMKTKEEPAKTGDVKNYGPALLWTEKYCPTGAADILGNAASVKKLKNWLSEWKHVLDREARKARKLMMKKSGAGKLAQNKKGDVWDDDSDFACDSDDSADDDSLCNTVLLSGPHGCGKTSSVYGLALEMGFKVHEVNTSSCRSGKQILSQLQEATQSHQVSAQGNHTPRKNTRLDGSVAPTNPAEKPKMATSFTNLFKKAAGAEAPQAGKKPAAESSKRRKRHLSDKDGSPKSKRHKDERPSAVAVSKSMRALMTEDSQSGPVRSMNLSSTTLILFDEVDVIFEEDRGFLSAIQSFMANTKIPIILTTADPGFTQTFDGRFDHIPLKRPLQAQLCSYLQTLALVENVRTDSASMSDLVQMLHCDVRRCVLSLQYHLLSGGGGKVKSRALPRVENTDPTSVFGKKSPNASSCDTDVKDNCIIENSSTGEINVPEQKESRDCTKSIVNDGDDDDDDFVTLKPFKKRRHFLEDDISNSSDVGLSETAVIKPVVTDTQENNLEAKDCPLVHCIGSYGVLSSISENLSSNCTTRFSICASVLRDFCLPHVLYKNIHILLPLKCQTVLRFMGAGDNFNSETKSRKRIKIASDLYDTEASNDATEMDTNVAVSSNDSDTHGQQQKTRQENMCLVKGLSSFARFYETMSFLDNLDANSRRSDLINISSSAGRRIRGSLVAGMENEFSRDVSSDTCCDDMYRQCSVEVETRAVGRFYHEVETVNRTVESLTEETEAISNDFTLPVLTTEERFNLTSCLDRPRCEVDRARDNCTDNLPLTIYNQPPVVTLDYLPTLRNICQTEQNRLAANTKRRFHHYLDSIALALKERTMATLATALR